MTTDSAEAHPELKPPWGSLTATSDKNGEHFGEQLFPNVLFLSEARGPQQNVDSEQQGLGLMKLLNRCRTKNSRPGSTPTSPP
jgi:hypothetical protein